MKPRVLFAVLAALVAAGLAVVVILFLVREDPGARSIDDALEDFRSDAPGEPSQDEDVGESEPAGPPAGVYELSGSGSESISFPPLAQSDGETMPMTIRSTGADCWNTRIDFNEAHWQDWELCSDGDAILESGGRTFQSWDLGATAIENTSLFTCEPAVLLVDLGAEEGDTWQRSCTGTNDAVAGETVTSGTDTVVAHEILEVAGESVDTIHVRSDQQVSGAQSGAITNDFWFRTRDGLPIRGERSSTIDSDSPVGTITYTETGSWQLASLEPQG